MPIYRIGYSTYEESHYVETEHDEEFTHEQLRGFVFDALLAAAISEYEESKRWYHETEGQEDRKFDYISVGSLMENPEFDKCLCEKHGFRKMEYQERFTMFGWSSPFGDREGWGGETDDDEKEMLKNLKTEFHKYVEENSCCADDNNDEGE